MAILAEYHRPQSITEAIQLLSRTDVRLLPLAGGTRLVGQLETRQRRDVDGVVDLRELGLSTIEDNAQEICIGAMATLSDVMGHAIAGSLASGILRRTARCEGPINLRNASTIGGVVASAEMDSEFYAALLALDASVVTSDGKNEHVTKLSDWTGVPAGQLITEVRLPVADLHGGHARVARTPSDRPIVAAVAVAGDRVPSGRERIALCGIAPTPILDGQQSPAAFSDFKGSAEYRLAAADVVKRRALQEAKGG